MSKPLQHNYGWICPKCETVYNPDVEECWHCNDEITNDEITPFICITCGDPAYHQIDDLGGWLCDKHFQELN